jgi:hypothetical protein
MREWIKLNMVAQSTVPCHTTWDVRLGKVDREASSATEERHVGVTDEEKEVALKRSLNSRFLFSANLLPNNTFHRWEAMMNGSHKDHP